MKAIEESEELLMLLLLVGLLGLAIYIFYQWRGLKVPALGDVAKALADWFKSLLLKIPAATSSVGTAGTDSGGAQIETGIYSDPTMQSDGVYTQ